MARYAPSSRDRHEQRSLTESDTLFRFRDTKRILALVFVHLFWACERDGLEHIDDPFDEPERFKLDAGVHDDAETEPMMIPEPDASVATDAGEVEPETCMCPALPTSCTQPVADRPFFSPSGGFVTELMNLFACADTSIHLAMYETDLTCIVDALIARQNADPDLEIDLVIDDDRCARETDGTLSCDLARLEGRARITVVDDMRSRYMHDKFAVIDGAFVWTGSGNLTRRSLCTDANDGILIEQPEIVAAFEGEFARMFTDRVFGPRTRVPPTTGGPYTVYFGPESPLAEAPSWHLAILEAIGSATSSIEVMVFAWTHTDIADALVEAHGRGVLVRGLVAPSYVGDAPAQTAIAGGIAIRTASVHSKVILIDGLRIITGTPNWSANSWANDETSLWIDDPAIAADYGLRFDELWSGSHPP
jgi:hypothetical protein